MKLQRRLVDTTGQVVDWAEGCLAVGTGHWQQHRCVGRACKKYTASFQL